MVCHSHIAKHTLLHGAKEKSHPSACLPATGYRHLCGKNFSLLEKKKKKKTYNVRITPEKSSLIH